MRRLKSTKIYDASPELGKVMQRLEKILITDSTFWGMGDVFRVNEQIWRRMKKGAYSYFKDMADLLEIEHKLRIKKQGRGYTIVDTEEETPVSPVKVEKEVSEIKVTNKVTKNKTAEMPASELVKQLRQKDSRIKKLKSIIAEMRSNLIFVLGICVDEVEGDETDGFKF